MRKTIKKKTQEIRVVGFWSRLAEQLKVELTSQLSKHHHHQQLLPGRSPGATSSESTSTERPTPGTT